MMSLVSVVMKRLSPIGSEIKVSTIESRIGLSIQIETKIESLASRDPSLMGQSTHGVLVDPLK